MLFWIKLIVLEVIAALSQENYECKAFLTRVFTQNWVCSPEMPLRQNRWAVLTAFVAVISDHSKCSLRYYLRRKDRLALERV
ncbi:hypothetical protein N9359_04250 [Luminiphilus sp.]|nr:hypothetical protein [Luminiphilus sp.]